MASKIQWTGETLNPIRARDIATGRVGWFCEHASDGCRFCYAEAMNNWRGNRIPYLHQNRAKVEIFLDDDVLRKAMAWQKPKTIFPCSMTDMFADFVTNTMLDSIFAVMAITERHTWQPLTKRPERALAYIEDRCRTTASFSGPAAIVSAADRLCGAQMTPPELRNRLPLPNVHLGTSIEQRRHLWRLDHLRLTPAALRWISLEPLLEDIGPLDLTGISWVVIGGESGKHARPFYLRWALDIIAQCEAAGVAVFVKQIGSNPMGLDGLPFKVQHEKGGDMDEWPPLLRVRQMPGARTDGR